MKSTPTTPRDALTALVDAMIERNTLQVTEFVQGIYRQGWALKDFADPAYGDPLRQALAASVLEAMVEVWGEPMHGRTESAPAWCEDVPAVQEPFSLIPEAVQVVFAREAKHPAFAKRGIEATRRYLHFA